MKKISLIALLASLTLSAGVAATLPTANVDNLVTASAAAVHTVSDEAALRDAVANAAAGDTVTLGADIEIAQELHIAKAITLDLGTHTLKGAASLSKTVRLFADVKITNGTIENSYAYGRGVDMRDGCGSLELDGVTVTTLGSGNTQAITVGGNQANRVLTIKNSMIKAGNLGYAVIVFNPVAMNIENSTLGGYCSLYFKAANSSVGSSGSVVNVKNSTLGSVKHTGYSNDFGAIVLEDGGVSVTLDKDCTIDADDTNAVIFSSAMQANVAPIQIDIDPEATVTADKLVQNSTTVLDIVDNGNGSITVDDEADTVALTVATVNGEKYSTLAAAVENAATGDTVTLIADCELTEKLVIDKEIVLDLNGKKLTLAVGNDSNYDVIVKADLTITGNGFVHAESKFGFGLTNGVLTVENGTFTAEDTNSYLIGVFGGKAVINGGNFTVPYCVANAFEGYSVSVEVNGGNFTVTNPENRSDAAAVLGLAEVNGVTYGTFADAMANANDGDTMKLVIDYELKEKLTIDKEIVLDLNGKKLTLKEEANPNNYAIVVKGDLTITGNGFVHVESTYGIGLATTCTGGLTVENGTFTAADSNYYVIGAFGGKVVINGGDFTVPYNAVNAFDGYTTEAEVNGGNFTITGTEAEANAVLGSSTVKGGTYNTDVSAYVEDGYLLVKNSANEYAPAVEASVAATIGTIGYATLNEAVADAANNAEIVLNSDVALTQKLTIDKTIVLNLNGKKLTLKEAANPGNYAILVKGDLTITGNGFVHVESTYGIGLSTTCTGGLTIENGTFTAEDGNFYIIGAFAGKVVINGGDFTVPYCVANAFAGYSTEVQVNDGNFTVTDPDSDGAILGLAELNGVVYGTFADAIADANDGDTIKLVVDYDELDEAIAISDGKEITLDLNGKTLSGAEIAKITNGTLNVVNGTVHADVDAFVLNTETVVSGAAELNIASDVTVEAGDCAVIVKGNATLNTEGTLKGGLTNNYATITGNGTEKYWGTTINVNGGSVLSGPAGDLAIYHPQDGTLTVNGGYIEGLTGIEMRNGELTVNGGEIVSTATTTTYVPNNNGSTVNGAAIAVSDYSAAGAPNVAINGGKFEGASALYVSDANHGDVNTIVITDGDFVGAVTADNADITISGGSLLADAKDEAIAAILGANNENVSYVTRGMELSIERAATVADVKAARDNALAAIQAIKDEEAAEEAEKAAAILADAKTNARITLYAEAVGHVDDTTLANMEDSIANATTVAEVETALKAALATVKAAKDAALNEKFTALETTLSTLIQDVPTNAELAAELDALYTELDAAMQSYKAGLSTETSVNNALTALETRLNATLSAAIADLKTDIQNKLDAQSLTLKDYMDVNLGVINTAITTLNTTVTNEFAALNTKVDDLNDLIDALDTIVDGIDSELTDFRTEANGKLDAHTMALDGLKTQLDSVLADTFELKNKVDALNGKVDAIDGAIGDVQTAVNGVKDEVDTVEEEIAELETALATLTANVATLQAGIDSDVDDLTTKLGEIEGKVDATKTALEGKIDTLSTTLSALIEAVPTNSEFAATIAQLKSDLDAIVEGYTQGSSSDISGDISALESKVNALKAELNQAIADNATATQDKIDAGESEDKDMIIMILAIAAIVMQIVAIIAILAKKKQQAKAESIDKNGLAIDQEVVKCEKCGVQLKVKADGNTYMCPVCNNHFRVQAVKKDAPEAKK